MTLEAAPTELSGRTCVVTGANGGIATYTNAEALTVNGLQGDDTINVVPGAIPIFIDGGDPIATVGDRLVVFPPTVPTLMGGPENDEGGVSFVGPTENVSFDHIEAVTIDLGPGPGPGHP